MAGAGKEDDMMDVVTKKGMEAMTDVMKKAVMNKPKITAAEFRAYQKWTTTLFKKVEWCWYFSDEEMTLIQSVKLKLGIAQMVKAMRESMPEPKGLR